MEFWNKLKKIRQSKHHEQDINNASSNTEKVTNPYLEAKAQYEDRYGKEVKTSARLRRICLVLVVLCLSFGGCMIWLSAQNKVVPYIVQIDRHGYTVSIKSAEEGSATNDKVIIATLGRTIMDFRTVVSDSRAQEKLIANVYACIAKGTSAEQVVHEYYKENNPYVFSKSGLGKIVDINAITPFSAKGSKSSSSWQILWTEQTTEKGIVVGIATFRAIISVSISPVRDLDQVISNPLGIYLTDIHITKDIK